MKQMRTVSVLYLPNHVQPELERCTCLMQKKYEKIFEAACREFLENPYSSVCVKRLAEAAGISRSGFYIYFKGKDDLFCWMLQMMFDEACGGFLDCFIKSEGDFYRAALMALEHTFLNGRMELCQALCKKIAMEGECRTLALMTARKYCNSGAFCSFTHQCFTRRDTDRYCEQREEQYVCAMKLGISIVIKTFTICGLYGDCHSDTDRFMKAMCCQLGIIENALRSSSVE